MKYIAAFLIMLFSASAAQANERWVVYYGDELPAERFAPFDVIVLDSDYSAPVATLKEQGKTVLGYLSLGEAENYRPYFNQLKDKHLLLGNNPAWPGHYVIDIRNDAWTEIVLRTLIPEILKKGFDGVMFDTIDSPIHIGHKNPEEAKAMQQAATTLVCAVRDAYPHIKIMLNRGFEILPAVAPCINMLLAESIRTDLQLNSKKEPKLLSDEAYNQYVSIIKEAQTVSPALKVYTLDYWAIKDKAGIKDIYATQRRHGFIPYVSSIALQTVYPDEP